MGGESRRLGARHRPPARHETGASDREALDGVGERVQRSERGVRSERAPRRHVRQRAADRHSDVRERLRQLVDELRGCVVRVASAGGLGRRVLQKGEPPRLNAEDAAHPYDRAHVPIPHARRRCEERRGF
eukprot:493339-Prymnesium_polylepis.1